MPCAKAYKQLFVCSFESITMVSAAIYYSWSPVMSKKLTSHKKL